MAHRISAFLVLCIPLTLLTVSLMTCVRHAPEAERRAMRHLEEIARAASDTLDNYLLRVTNHLLTLARAPDIRHAVMLANEHPRVEKDVEKIDAHWKTQHTPPPAQMEIVTGETGKFLEDLVCPRPSSCALLPGREQERQRVAPGAASSRREQVLREIGISDAEGRLVAASNVTDDYDQKDEQWFSDARDNAKACEATADFECIVVGQAELDASAESYGFDIAVPVLSRERKFAGVLNALVGLEELSALLRAAMPPGVRAAVVRIDNPAVVIDDRGTTDGPPSAPTHIRELSNKLSNTPRVKGDGRVPTRTAVSMPMSKADGQTEGLLIALTAYHLETQGTWHVLVWQDSRAATASFGADMWTTAVMSTLLVVLVVSLLAVAILSNAAPGASAPPRHQKEAA